MWDEKLVLLSVICYIMMTVESLMLLIRLSVVIISMMMLNVGLLLIIGLVLSVGVMSL